MHVSGPLDEKSVGAFCLSGEVQDSTQQINVNL